MPRAAVTDNWSCSQLTKHMQTNDTPHYHHHHHHHHYLTIQLIIIVVHWITVAKPKTNYLEFFTGKKVMF